MGARHGFDRRRHRATRARVRAGSARSKPPLGTPDVIAQACAVKSATLTAAQVALIVRNNWSSLFGVSTAQELWMANTYGEMLFRLGAWNCPYSGVAAHSWSVCFGQTKSIQIGERVIASGTANTRPIGVTTAF